MVPTNTIPTCIVNGRSVPAVVTCSESGSITSDILMQVPKHLDMKLCIDRTKAMPFLLLDSHGSCLELPFLDYVNAADTKWTVCIGVPPVASW